MVPTSKPPACPAKAAEWFSHAFEEMTKVNLGGHFNAVLDAWVRIEAACAFENPKMALPSKGRPEHVGRWIQGARGRRNQQNPVVHDPVKYAKEWWIWWNSLQPEWRVKESDGIAWVVGGAYGKEWDSLTFWGQNVVVVASLYFWGCAVADAAEEQEAWELAVNDVAWVFEGLALFHEKFKKRR
ncbi:hypothetical protein B0H11DRAFT_1745371 [Mycena galericulata]|nr:hypothetical protein B0H11DRAFT_1745371 [Mycena galericulata]